MALLCVSSPKGGVGKTTVAANVAWELARAGRRVIALDLDPQNSVGLHFGMSLADAKGFMARLTDLAADRARPADEAAGSWRGDLRHSRFGVDYLPYGQSDMGGANTLSLALAARPDLLVAPLRDMLADGRTLVVADLPPGPSPTLHALLPLADLLAVVLRVDAPSLAQLPAIESGRAYGLGPSGPEAAKMGFVLNGLDLRTRLGRASGDTASRHLGARLLGVIYRDENVSEAIATQRLVGDYQPNSKAAQDIAALAGVIARRLPASENTAPAQEDGR